MIETDAIPEADFEYRQRKLIAQIDTDVDSIYQDVTGQRGPEYAVAESEALAYQGAGYNGAIPGSVQGWATAKSQSAEWAADSIISAASGWRDAQGMIRSERLLRKEQLRAAVDDEALALVWSQWSGFVVEIRSQLVV